MGVTPQRKQSPILFIFLPPIERSLTMIAEQDIHTTMLSYTEHHDAVDQLEALIAEALPLLRNAETCFTAALQETRGPINKSPFSSLAVGLDKLRFALSTFEGYDHIPPACTVCDNATGYIGHDGGDEPCPTCNPTPYTYDLSDIPF